MTTASPRAALSRELIASTALAITDAEGLAGLSMRKLGNELGVEAMSLYHYIENKDDLLDAVLDSLYAEIDLPLDLPAEQWETATRRGLQSFHHVLVHHPAALELFATRPARSPEALRVLGWSYDRFKEVGLDETQAVHALHVGIAFVMGHVASELGAMAAIADGAGVDLDELDDEQLAQMFRHRRTITGAELFASGLDAVVAGLRSSYDLP